MVVCEAVLVAASFTMILLDPDLDPDPAPGELKGATLHDSLNMERKLRVPSARTLSRFLREAQAAVRLRGLVSVLLTTDTAIRRLNRTFRGKNKATDVLSFPAAKLSQVSKARPGTPAHQQVSGDLAISVETARRQAGEQGHALAVELKVLMLHGLLHLAGYDHETDAGKMERRERLLRARLGLPQGLIERSSLPTLAPEKRRKDGARSVSARPVESLRATARPKTDRVKLAGVRA
jgi:probable rRNA maturation factor